MNQSIRFFKSMCLALLIISAYPLMIPAQNLVPNPDFEGRTGCPTSPGDFTIVNNWYIMGTHGGSADYHHVCGSTTFGVPSNVFGNEPARSGSGYAGFVTYFVSANFREYLQVQLTSPLVPGQSYDVEGWMSLGDPFGWANDGMGFHFTTTPITGSGTSNALGFTPTVENPANSYINTQAGWQQVGGSFVAGGGEQYLTLGNFKNDANTNIQVINGGWTWCYVYLEDVSVTPATVFSADLSELSGAFSGNTVVLDWESFSESGTQHYSVERSIGNTRNFEEITTVDAKGSTNTGARYQVFDPMASLSEANYYRIREFDQNGAGGYSNTISVIKPGVHPAPEMNVFPNPLVIGDQLQVALSAAEKLSGKLELVDMMGREIFSMEIDAENGHHTQEFATGELAPGNYLIVYRSGGNILRKTVSVQ